jgi:ABC-type lipoprotein release transport system permease subunit
MDKEIAKRVLNLEKNEASDIALVVPNKLEIDNISQKITFKYPNLKIVTKEDLKEFSNNLYDYKGGIFLSIFILSFLAFLVIFYSQASSNSGANSRQIGILRAIGWSINDILKWKMSEALIISIISYMLGVLLSYLYIFFSNNNIFLNILLGSENIKFQNSLYPHIDINSFIVLFFVTIIPYLASTLHPAWKSAITDPTEAVK